MHTLVPHIKRIATLRDQMPELIAAHPNDEALLRVFDARSQAILGAAADDCLRRFLWRAIQFILIDYGYVPEAVVRSPDLIAACDSGSAVV